jgi:hypothetical protein
METVALESVASGDWLRCLNRAVMLRRDRMGVVEQRLVEKVAEQSRWIAESVRDGSLELTIISAEGDKEAFELPHDERAVGYSIESPES